MAKTSIGLGEFMAIKQSQKSQNGCYVIPALTPIILSFLFFSKSQFLRPDDRLLFSAKVGKYSDFVPIGDYLLTNKYNIACTQNSQTQPFFVLIK